MWGKDMAEEDGINEEKEEVGEEADVEGKIVDEVERVT